MQLINHSNAKTNVNIREQIQSKHSSTNEDLAFQFGTSTQTVSKWRNRLFTSDASCVPNNIVYALIDLEASFAISLRSATWFALDEVLKPYFCKTIQLVEAHFIGVLLKMASIKCH